MPASTTAMTAESAKKPAGAPVAAALLIPTAVLPRAELRKRIDLC